MAGTKPYDSLNSDDSLGSFSGSAIGLVGEIKETVNAIKTLNIDVQGQVDYATIAGSAAYRTLRNLTAALPSLNLDQLKTQSERYAFWINLYNALTLDAVIQFGVKESVTQGFLGVLTFFERAAYRIDGFRFSLMDIEHGVLRANQGFPYFWGEHFGSMDPRKEFVLPLLEPRIHFALNCASRSCPPIGVYSPDQIECQLEIASRNFVDANIRLNKGPRSLSLSAIFRWYAEDFGGRQGILDFLIKTLPDGSRKTWLEANYPSVRFQYQEYDWGLNGRFD
jgi:hypothetical protein